MSQLFNVVRRRKAANMVEISPMITVLAIGERCAELVAEAQGWRREVRPKL